MRESPKPLPPGFGDPGRAGCMNAGSPLADVARPRGMWFPNGRGRSPHAPVLGPQAKDRPASTESHQEPGQPIRWFAFVQPNGNQTGDRGCHRIPRYPGRSPASRFLQSRPVLPPHLHTQPRSILHASRASLPVRLARRVGSETSACGSRFRAPPALRGAAVDCAECLFAVFSIRVPTKRA